MSKRICETDRLIVRRYTLDDAAGALAIYADPQVMRWLGTGTTKTIDTIEQMRSAMTERWFPRYERTPQFGHFATVLKSNNQIVGSTLLKDLDGSSDIEIGWHFASFAWGHGYASEAARGVMRYGFDEVGLKQIVAVVHPTNERSKAVCRRIGLTPAGKRITYTLELDYFTAIHNTWPRDVSDDPPSGAPRL
jgi:RimJ/RimL family protein N-acetyltransferase